MTYLYKLKLQDNAEWLSLCNPVIDDEPKQASWLNNVEGIVVIGTITKPAIIEDGEVVKEAETIEGWHVDILAHTLIQELKDFVPDTPPSNPVHGYGWVEGQKFIIVTKQDYL